MSLFRYGLDYVQMAIQRLIGFGKKEEFKEILAILRRQNPDRIRVLWNLSCTERVDITLHDFSFALSLPEISSTGHND